MNKLETVSELYARPLVLWAAGLAFGICTGSGRGFPGLIFAVFLVTAGVLTLKSPGKKNERRIIIVFIFVLSFLFGYILIEERKNDEETGFIPKSSLKETVVSGIVSDIALSKEKYLIKIKDPIIKLKDEYDGNTVFEREGSLIIYTDSLNVKNGDMIEAKGTLYPFSPASNYGQFDFRSFYYAKGIYLKFYSDEVSCIKKNEDLFCSIKQSLFDISQNFGEGLGAIYDVNTKGILDAMLTGDKSSIDESTKEIYKRIGIAHILCISGLHITLIGMGLFNLLMKLFGRLKMSIIISCLFVFLYGLLTGFSVSTVRAVIMLFCMLIGKLLGRAYDGQSAAAFASMLILVVNPSRLFESGFLLSFLAVFGIFAGNEIRINLGIKNRVLVYFIPGFFAELATFPVIISTYYSFSPYSLIANPILLPFMPFIVVSGILAGIFGCSYLLTGSGILFFIGSVSGGAADFFLNMYDKVSEFLLSLDGADIICGCPDIKGCVIYYIILFMLVFMSSKKYFISENSKINRFDDVKPYQEAYNPSECLKIILVFVISLAVMLLSVLIRPNGIKESLSFIDVGQGLSVYMEANGKHILMDGGSSNVKDVGKYRIEPFLLWKGCDRLDYVLVSHTDADHISGIKELISNGRIGIGCLIMGCNYDVDEELASMALANGIDVRFVSAGDEIDDTGQLKMKVLSPDPGFIYEDKNQASMVVEISDGNFNFLFTGDSDIYSETEYVRYLSEKTDILQCPHHGSKYSTSELLLEKAQPKVTVISCALKNVYGHPSPETVERLELSGSDIYSTPESGMITVYYDDDGTFKVIPYIEQAE